MDKKNSRFCLETDPPDGHSGASPGEREPSVSLTTLAAPKEARKAYERAEKELNKKTPDLARAAGELERAIAAGPQFEKAYLRLAVLELARARHVQAAALADRVLQLNPSLTEAHYYRAVAHSQLGYRDKAKESLLTVMKRGEGKRFPGAYALLGDLYAAEGKADLAVAEYRRLLELYPNSPLAAEARIQLEAWRVAGLIK